MGSLPRFRQQAGMTLVEVMVAAVLLMIGLVTVAGLIDAANRSTVTSRERQAATNLTRELIEAARGISYASISSGSGVLSAIGAADAQLADSEGGNPHTIVRSNVTYTVTSDVCIMDDARDGGGTHSGGGFCPDSAPENYAPPGSGTDRVPEDYKRITVTTSWKTRGPQRIVKQTTLVNNPGSAGAPAVSTLTATSPALGNPPAQVGPGTSSISFAATTSSTPAQVKWLLDGAGQGLATGSGKSWSFVWDLGTAGAAGSYQDGPYLVSAEAYDQYGVSGASRSMTITLNRTIPTAPRGLAGGRNGNIVELEWLPNPERDLAGYRTYRFVGDTEVLVCSLSFATSCIDSSPLNQVLTEYRVYAYDRDSAGVLRHNGTYASINVTLTNTPPMSPKNPQVVFDAGNNIATLTWDKPSPVEDTDAGDYIAFYRIYRDGTGINNRYTKVDTTGTTHSLQDVINGTPHRYYVSAVDSRYGESNIIAFSGNP